MPRIPALFRMLVMGQSSHDDLVRQVHFLTVENRLLRARLPKRVRLTPRERRRLIRFGKPLGTALKGLISIVQYDTFCRWVREGTRRKHRRRSKVGRPPTPAALRELVVRMAKTPGWGYRRIIGELRKLGIKSISRTTVRSILKARGIEPAPDRSEPVWDNFLKRHASTLWACDYFTKHVLTMTGIRRYTLLVFMHIKSRKVIVTKAVEHPSWSWAAEVGECFAGMVQRLGLPSPTIMLRDNDGKFGPGFDEALEEAGTIPMRLPVQAPLMNAHVDRWIKSIKTECLNHFLPVGSSHLDHLVTEYICHYHEERPHQGLGNKPILDTGPPPVAGRICCSTRLGGLLRHYHRAA